MMISTFDELIAAARSKVNEQHLLLVYTRAELPDHPTPQQRREFEQGHGGVLVPQVCVDKTIDELTDFATLRDETQAYVNKWDVMFAAAVEAPAMQSLTHEQIDHAMEIMLDRVKGGRIEGLIAFNREGNAIDPVRGKS